MDGSDGFLEYYASNRQKYVFIWGLLSGLVLLCWIVHVLPFSYASTVSQGVVTGRHCANKGFSYTYSYEVDGETYTGGSGWGGLDGNGPCQSLVPGVVVPITYRTNDPWRSMGGTVHSWTRTLVHLLLFVAFISFVGVPIPMYFKAMRSND